MKLILTLVFTSLLATSVLSQAVTYEDFKAIIPYLQKEDFKNAFEKSSQLLSSTQNDSSDLRGIVTYINIFSAAGMVSIGQMTHDNFLKTTTKYIGQYIVMPAHPCIDSSKRGFNTLKFTTEDGRLQGNTPAANHEGTSILCFEYFEYAEPINPNEYVGKNVRCGGILKSVDVNPNKSTIWITRLRISNAFARVVE